MLLTDHPIRINNREIIWPDQWSESSEVIENLNQTAAGTDQTEVTRYDKLTVSCSFSCSPEWAARFKAWSKADSVTLTKYNIETGTDEDRTVRLRNFSCELQAESYRIVPNGIWTVTFDMIQF